MLLVLKTKMIVWTTVTKKLKEIKKLFVYAPHAIFRSVFKNSSNLYRLLFFFIKSLIGWSFQNYRQRYAYIITEMPQVHTIIDFCRLLQQEECRTIVMLNSGFTDTQVHVQFRVCYSVIIIISYEKFITNW